MLTGAMGFVMSPVYGFARAWGEALMQRFVS
jgi:hypothetical protein